jgi:hypothetical protein
MEMTSTGVPVLGQVSIVVGDDEDILELDKIVPIGDDLSEEFSRQPSLYAYVAMLSAQAESAWGTSKQETERTKARIDKVVRDRARQNDEKVTESVVYNRVLMNDEVKEAEETEAAYRYQFLVMKAIVQSMDQRAQMLISLGAHLRAEAEQTGMIIKDTKARLDAIKAIHRASQLDGKR